VTTPHPALVTADQLTNIVNQHNTLLRNHTPRNHPDVTTHTRTLEQLANLYTCTHHHDYQQPLSGHAVEQLAHILHHRRHHHPGTALHATTYRLLHYIHATSLIRIRITSLPTVAVLNDTTDADILTCARWWPLPIRITAGHPPTPHDTTSSQLYRHAAHTLRTIAHNHTDTTLDIAQQLAVDNPDITWDNLIGTATALTTPP
jgi:hypothetical protein